MRRVGIFLLAVIALMAMTGPVSAQPKVTITGFVDNITSYSKNMSVVDINPARSSDREWYARTRVRPDITAEVGTTKFVLGLEIDAVWGQTATTGDAVLGQNGVINLPQRSGATGGWDLNTDTIGQIEIKWAYTEFQMPLVPIPTLVRLGAQPWQAHYKLAVLANGDFAGVHVTSQLAPPVKLNLTYAQVEERSTGTKDLFVRGDDFALVTSVEITPFKGLDIRPIFSYFFADGTTNGAARQARGGVSVGATTTFPTCPGTAGPGTGSCVGAPGSQSATEDRFTVGLDTRWRFGAFSLDPTIFYQFGSRDQVRCGIAGGGCVLDNLRRDAWFFDVRGGWQAGPLLLELAGVYTTGNKAQDRIDIHPDVVGSGAATCGANAALGATCAGRRTSRMKFYEPISTDTSYFATWAEIWALGIDYFNIIRSGAAGLNPGVAIGYDKYGLIRAGARVSYALTPAFTLRAAASASWTAEEVDTSSILTAGTGLIPVDARGNARFLGTEVDLGFQWRFAPNVAFDLVAAYMFAGNALATHVTTSAAGAPTQNGRDPQDIQTVAARIRYSW